MSVCVEFQPIGRRVDVQEHMTVLDAARLIVFQDQKIMTAPCGGRGQCGRCRIRLLEGTVNEPTESETKLLSADELNQGVRLACQTEVLGPVKIEIPPESLVGKQNLQLEGLDYEIEVEPASRRYVISTEAPAIHHPVSTWQQIVRELESEHNVENPTIDMELLRQEIPKEHGRQLTTVTLQDREIINRFDVFPAPRSLGLAVDLGTTKIAAFLVDLESGDTIGSEARMNPQIAYGEDLMSRLAYCRESASQSRQMQALVVDSLNKLLANLLSKTGAGIQQVEHAVIVGNSAMHHILVGLPVHALARSPYVPAATLPIEVKSRSLGLNLATGASVYFAPLIAGFVGGDHVAMIAASRIFECEGVTLGLDIGTNTEIVLAVEGRLTSCSCASGPAFEGAHIHHGMRAVEGAVSSTTWSEEEQKLHYRTIADAPALGLCGSGVIDAVASLAEARIVNHMGLFDRSRSEVRIDEKTGHPEYVIVPEEKSGTGHDITLTQKDIVAIQLAKAAISTGTRLLLSEAGLNKDDVDKIIIAGAFGSNINVESAVFLGLLPNVPLERFQNVGNAAGTGARLMLLSTRERQVAEKIAKTVGYLELAAHPKFSQTFAKALEFVGSHS
ncbi:ASKHA domain-containing protein [Desulfomonile tiedjei]|uniref:Putative metal-binding protein n=1 Tax=Desulfomonile tiedjei (strain ATCC 49306 / DSM 6799 / DCB-1) TaxID=706587 RepID=I4CET6_DESTA|nr:ASKHA domain-containing protein [Desulfomonile tiedjei]AFM28077.1 putative metal-binding protein [Desulfomonile tiedjei DSM 6799]